MALYLTPNQRMAAFLGADALAIAEWCEQQYACLRYLDPSHPRPLSADQSLVLWEQVIRQSTVGQSFFNLREIAYLAFDAWCLSHQWCLEPLDPLLQTTHTEAYQEWAIAYQQQLQKIHALDAVQRVDYLIQKINDRLIAELPPQIEWIGFEEIIPQYAALWASLEKRGVVLRKKYLAQKKGNSGIIAAQDSKHELMLAAHQVKRWISDVQNISNGDMTQARIGIVVPDLQQRREALIQVFKHVLVEQAFTVSAPLSLDQYPFIDAAFFGIELMMQAEPLPFEWLSRLLANPFFGASQSQMNERAAFDLHLRNLGDPFISLKDAQKHSAFKWWFSLEDCAVYQQALSDQNTSSEWVSWIEGILQCLGWPGERVLNALEVALHNQWQQLLKNYEDLGSLLKHHTLPEALAQLKFLAKQSLFTIERMDPHAPIQVLGLLEATGLPFDRLWVMAMDQEQWPLKPNPNPFISFAVQRQKGLPRASVEREYQMAQRLTKRLMQQADEVVFSYALSRLDQPCGISPLLAHIPQRSFMALGLQDVPTSYLGTLCEMKPWHRVMPEAATPLKPGSQLKGGVRTLQLQALCPFRAFAASRLQAEPLKSVKLGLSGAERGQLVHRALEYFWKKISDQARLLSLSESALHLTLNQAIQKAISAKPGIKQRLEGLAGVLERERLQRLLIRLMWHEKQRSPFKVLALEKALSTELQGLKISMRIDRVDEVVGVGAVLIDYKTAAVSLKDWFSERLSDPQLPLYAEVYAADQQRQPIGVAFALINADRVGFKGVLGEALENNTPWFGMKSLKKFESDGAEANWVMQKAVWKTRVERLALEFAQGVAKVEPLRGAQTCRNCALKILCRVERPKSVV